MEKNTAHPSPVKMGEIYLDLYKGIIGSSGWIEGVFWGYQLGANNAKNEDVSRKIERLRQRTEECMLEALASNTSSAPLPKDLEGMVREHDQLREIRSELRDVMSECGIPCEDDENDKY